MSFHDQVHADFEGQARQAARTLVLYAKTIAPVTDVISDPIIEFAKNMGWELIEDENIGVRIK